MNWSDNWTRIVWGASNYTSNLFFSTMISSSLRLKAFMFFKRLDLAWNAMRGSVSLLGFKVKIVLEPRLIWGAHNHNGSPAWLVTEVWTQVLVIASQALYLWAIPLKTLRDHNQLKRPSLIFSIRKLCRRIHCLSQNILAAIHGSNMEKAAAILLQASLPTTRMVL